jgi:hypothetical protein
MLRIRIFWEKTMKTKKKDKQPNQSKSLIFVVKANSTIIFGAASG